MVWTCQVIFMVLNCVINSIKATVMYWSYNVVLHQSLINVDTPSGP